MIQPTLGEIGTTGSRQRNGLLDRFLALNTTVIRDREKHHFVAVAWDTNFPFTFSDQLQHYP
jgi:hypothetical protein